MDCPIDGTQLTMSERQGIEIDYCPKCRGVWLDRGELDKIIERTDQDLSRASEDRGAQGPPKKKKNMLSELFELGG
jgi:Zn-finger nucleic acid-binding protein